MHGEPSQVATGINKGDVIAGKYRVEKILGAGGMGVVVAAHHIQLDEKVALKFLLPEALANIQAVARFVREARAAVKIKSEHVARVIDVGTLETGAPYIVMEYLDGEDLDVWLRERGALPTEQAVEFVLQACVAVAEAHALGIVHRDLKPANLFCVRRSDGQLSIKVLDFGISKMVDPGTIPSMTQTSASVGSPVYMAPEQMLSSKTVDARADIWAFGVVLFELIGGQPPFHAESLMELGLKIATEPAPPLRSVRPAANPGLEAVVARCLEKDPGRRFQDVNELAQALLPFGPARAKASADRISGIIESAGMGSPWQASEGPPTVPNPGTLSNPNLQGTPGTLSNPNLQGTPGTLSNPNLQVTPPPPDAPYTTRIAPHAMTLGATVGTPPVIPEATPDSTYGKAAAIGIGVAAALLLLGGAAFFAMSAMSKGAPPPDSAANPVVTTTSQGVATPPGTAPSPTETAVPAPPPTASTSPVLPALPPSTTGAPTSPTSTVMPTVTSDPTKTRKSRPGVVPKCTAEVSGYHPDGTPMFVRVCK